MRLVSEKFEFILKFFRNVINYVIDGDKSTFCAPFPFHLFKIGLLVKSKSFMKALVSFHLSFELMNFISVHLTFEFMNLQTSQEL